MFLASAFPSCLPMCEIYQDVVPGWNGRGSQSLGHLLPLIKGEFICHSGQILIVIQWNVPSWSLCVPNLSLILCVFVCTSISVQSWCNRGSWAMMVLIHLFSPPSTLLSLHFHHLNGYMLVCACVCFGSQVFVYFCLPVWQFVLMHKTCWCVRFCSSKISQWLDCYQM